VSRLSTDNNLSFSFFFYLSVSLYLFSLFCFGVNRVYFQKHQTMLSVYEINKNEASPIVGPLVFGPLLAQ
jgi:hypothetical protein